MGARTLSNSSPNRYINIRRSIINVKKQVERISQFALFENNDEYLWGQIRASVGTFLNQYWMQGGLRGVSPDQAYYVKVDGTTTSDADIANGQVNIQIGIALEYPAEFVVINIGQLTGSSTAI
jgi:phage tail sheath protein FI